MAKSLYSQKEEEVIEFWKKEKIFERSISERPEDNPYVFYDGPPFATGLPHYGHILSSVIKDLVPRYQTMKGKRVRRRWGWDCHGLPIETIVEKELKISGKKQIEEKGIDLFNKTARSMVLTYVSQWKKTIERIGRFVDFDNSYKTMDTAYMESVWWALKQLWEKRLIYEGKKVLMYCPRCETPVSNAEISMDNSYKDVTEESLTVKFKVIEPQKHNLPENTFLLAWTTTPWTLPGNVALAVGEDINYTALRVEGTPELYIVASDLISKVFKGKKVEVVHDKIKGEKLVGLEYEPLFEIEKAKKSDKVWRVAPADFVTTEDGTGIVHTAVMYGEDDYELGKKIDLPQVPLLNSAGIFNSDAPEFIRGIFYKDAEEKIIKNLEQRNLIYDRFSYTHSYPFCWRCSSPLIYNAISAWFVDIQSKKDRIIELNEKLNWYPPNIKHGRFLNILKTAPDWNISRNRYWATPLPFWKCEKCQRSECIGSIEELKEKSRNYEEVYGGTDGIDLHRPQIDQIEIECSECKSNMKRIPEVVDAWVESASMPFAEWHYPFENEEEFKSRFPGQYIAEYIAQTRAWFYYMHTLSVLLFDEISFENVVCTGTILAEDGSKMSKSKGNFPDPTEALDKYGADALRYYLMSSVVMKADNLFFSERDLRDAYNKTVNISYNVLNFFKLYKNDRETSKDNSVQIEKSENVLDRWIIIRTNELVTSATKSLDQYDMVKYTREIKGFVEDLSTWWLRGRDQDL